MKTKELAKAEKSGALNASVARMVSDVFFELEFKGKKRAPKKGDFVYNVKTKTGQVIK